MASTSDLAIDSFAGFEPRGYLSEYYMRVDGENEKLLAFHARAHEIVPADSLMLEFGGGPTLYQLISAAVRAREIHFSEYSPANLREIQAWLDDDDDAFSWKPFIKAVLELEGGSVDAGAISDREALLRQRITTLLPGNAFETHPLGAPARYDVVSANFVMEGITDDLEVWSAVYANVTDMVRTGGYFINTVVTGAAYWRSGEQVFSAVALDEAVLREKLAELGFEVEHLETLEADVLDPDSPDYEGYSGMAMLVAKRVI
jgi:hypothetical protein